MAGYSLDTSSRVTTGPVDFGSTFSGGGTVVFGTSNPGVTAAVSNLTGNPWMLAIAGVVVLGAAYLYLRSRRK
jgi:LPXTG-motif cell wall-anchored protein